MRRLLVVVIVLWTGCALDTSVEPPLPDADTGALDTSVGDTGPVADSTPPADSSGPRDSTMLDTAMPEMDAAPPPDTSGGCTPADERCDGNSSVVCVGGMFEVESCTASRHCEMHPSGPACEPNVCIPDSSLCSGDRTSLVTCDARGASSTTINCDRGCESSACRPQTVCGETIYGTIRSGSMTIDLCPNGDDQDYIDGVDGCDFAPTAEDVMLRLELDRRRRVVVDTEDADGARDIDANAYIRSDCAVQSSQIVCDEDSGSGQDSRIDVTLDAGDYFLILDSDNWGSYRCGTVRVTVSFP